jgi:hypothetical protein
MNLLMSLGRLNWPCMMSVSPTAASWGVRSMPVQAVICCCQQWWYMLLYRLSVAAGGTAGADT